ncbi:MAG: cyclase family protein [candidate division KSB1 bacterium]|nr:cyclase family protein [candidate division KSB1 bacterium]
MVWIDLSHPVHPSMCRWPGDPLTQAEPWADLQTDGYFLQAWRFGEHSGTHLGAPRHFLQEGADCASIPVQHLVPLGLRLDVRAQVGDNADYLVTPEDATEISERLRHLSNPAAVLVCTGWDRFWSSPSQYLGEKNGELHFPGIALDTIEYLAQHSCVVGVGIDTPGIDGGRNEDFTAGKRCAELGWYHIENMTGLSRIPPQCRLFIGLLPLVGGSGSPSRVLAWVDEAME